MYSLNKIACFECIIGRDVSRTPANSIRLYCWRMYNVLRLKRQYFEFDFTCQENINEIAYFNDIIAINNFNFYYKKENQTCFKMNGSEYI